jgi:hypothetical protein
MIALVARSSAVRRQLWRLVSYCLAAPGLLLVAVQPALAQDGGGGGGGLLGGLADIIIGAITELLRILFSPIRTVIQQHGDALLEVVVGTPHPNAVFGAPSNGA